MKKNPKPKNISPEINYWKNPLANKVGYRRQLKTNLANNFIRYRRLARQYYLERDDEKLENIGSYLTKSLILFETVFSDHEFAQLIGANFNEVEKLRLAYNLQKHETPFFIILLVSGFEQDDGNPLANALTLTIKREFDQNPSLRKKAREIVEDEMPEVRANYYRLIEDKKGNQTLEKYYPSLKLVKR